MYTMSTKVGIHFELNLIYNELILLLLSVKNNVYYNPITFHRKNKMM